MPDTIPAASPTQANALRAVQRGELTEHKVSYFVNGPKPGQLAQCMNRGWVCKVGGVFFLTDDGQAALDLADLGLYGMSVAHARLLLAVKSHDVVKVGPDTKVARDRGNGESWHVAPAVPVYLRDKYNLAELSPGSHLWTLTDRGRRAADILAARIANS